MGPDELRGMLRLRQAELEEEARVVGSRLAVVESRLRMIEQENAVSPDYVVKTIPALRLVAQVRTIDPGAIGENLEEMFESVAAAGLREVDGALATPIATYDMVEDGLTVVAGYAWSGPAPEGCEVVGLPEQTAVCGVHLGEMARIQESWQALHRWVVDNGLEFTGPARELYVRAVPDDQADWVTELQQPVARRP